jgi:hypothetical protein
MHSHVTIILELPPEGKARARTALRGGQIRHFTPSLTIEGAAQLSVSAT